MTPPRRMCWIALLSLICYFGGAHVAAESGFAISGVAVDRASGAALNRTAITISPAADPSHRLTYVTGDDGRFTFSNVSAGKYNLSAQRRGYPQESLDESEGYSTAVVVGPGLDSEHIVFRLTKGGSISGTVVDEDGDPIGHAQVWLFERAISGGEEQVRMRGGSSASVSGDFHFSNLEPGAYLVAVQAHPWYAQNIPQERAVPPVPGSHSQGPAEAQDMDMATPASELDVAYPVTYYPDALDPSEASPITVAEGSKATVQVTLRAVPALRVDIADAGTETNRPNVTLSAKGPGGFNIPVMGQNLLSVNGHVYLSGIAPGQYVLASQKFDHGRPQTSGTSTVNLTGNSNVDAPTSGAGSLSGHVAFDGNVRPDDGVTLIFRAVDTVQGAGANVHEDGTFAVEGSVAPGRYRIFVDSSDNLYVKNLAVKGGTWTRGELDIPERGVVQLDVTMASGTKNLEGVVLRDDTPLAGAMVLIIPKDNKRWDLIGRDQSDSDGTFSIRGVPPGQYSILAIDDGRNLAYLDPAVIAPYLAGAQDLTVSGGQTPRVKVAVQARRR